MSYLCRMLVMHFRFIVTCLIEAFRCQFTFFYFAMSPGLPHILLVQKYNRHPIYKVF